MSGSTATTLSSDAGSATSVGSSRSSEDPVLGEDDGDGDADGDGDGDDVVAEFGADAANAALAGKWGVSAVCVILSSRGSPTCFVTTARSAVRVIGF